MATRIGSLSRRLDVAAVVVFSAALGAPAVDMALRPASERDSRPENRTPAPRPPMPRSAADLLAWPQAFENHFADTFGLRDHLLGVRNSALVDLRLSPTDLLDVGERGWIFYRGDMEREAQRGTYTLSPKELAAWVDALEERRIRLEARGTRFLFALAPDKETVYPEFRPALWAPVGPTMGDLFLGALSRSKVDFIDLRPALRAEKAHDRPDVEDFVYFPRGSHWTSRGACAAATAILEHLRAWYPGFENFDCRTLVPAKLDSSGEESWVLNLYARWRLRPYHYYQPAGGWPVDPSQAPTGPLDVGVALGSNPLAPSVLFLHDSYGPFLIPILAQRARRLRSQWQSWVPEDVVDVERPDVVLMVRAERMLSQPPDPDARTTPTPRTAPSTEATRIWDLALDPKRARIQGVASLDRADGGVVWKTQDRMDHLVVDGLRTTASSESLVVSYDIEAPSVGNLEIWPSERGVAGWPGKRRLRIPLAAGRNTGDVVLPIEDFGGATLLRLVPPGSWRIHRLEMNASSARQPGEVR